MENPWQVDSIKAFACLKCPECAFNTNIENKFTDHAVENHPLSFVLFGKSEEVTKVKMEEDTENSWSIFSYINESVEPIQVKNEPNETNVEENINNANPDINESNTSNQTNYNENAFSTPAAIRNKGRHATISEKWANWRKAHEKNRPKTNVLQSTTIKCKDCKFVCRAMATLNRHIATVHSLATNLHFNCNICDQVYSSQLGLDKHVFKEHEGKNHFECERCEYKCKEKEQLMAHSKTVHEGKKLTTPQDKTQNEMNLSKCEICNGSFANDFVLKWHKEQIHDVHLYSTILKKPFKCDNCNKRFSRKAILQTHLESHEGRKPYHCAVCKANFSSHHDLRKHFETIHEGKNPKKKSTSSTTSGHKA